MEHANSRAHAQPATARARGDLAAYLLSSAAWILFATALIKVVSVLGEARVLTRPDPLFWFLTNRQFLFLVALVELAVVAALLRPMPFPFRASLVAALATAFLAYRFGLWWIGYEGECACLGHIGEWIGLKPKTVDLISNVLLLYLLTIAYGLLATSLLSGRSLDLQVKAL